MFFSQVFVDNVKINSVYELDITVFNDDYHSLKNYLLQYMYWLKILYFEFLDTAVTNKTT